MSSSAPTAVILAAGRGTRMRSQLPKVLHPVAGKPMLEWVLDTARQAGCGRLLVVVRPDSDEIREHFRDAADIEWVLQPEPKGTGHAVAVAEPHVGPGTAADSTLLVLSGDVPLVTVQTLRRLLEAAEAGWGSMAVAELEQPGSLGRVLSTGDGQPGPEHLSRIVEAADAAPEELAVRCINAGLYALPAGVLFEQLRQLDTDNAQGELYLTDAVTGAAAAGHPVALVDLDDPAEAWGVNTRVELARVHQRLLRRHTEALMLSGVTLLDPERTTIEPCVRVGRDTVIHSGVTLLGDTEIGQGCELHAGVWLRDSRLADCVEVLPYSVIEGAELDAGGRVGPFTRLRPGAELGPDVRIGNFVEVKKSRLARGVKAGHLAYIGDAEIGEETNVGAGVVTCNYDGRFKHKTTIGAEAFIGSDTMLVAPVKVGDRATTAAGSTITQDVPEEHLGVGRGRQRNVPGWRQRQEKKWRGEES